MLFPHSERPASIARCTSSLVTRPPGPVPPNVSASMPCRSASRCATGVTWERYRADQRNRRFRLKHLVGCFLHRGNAGIYCTLHIFFGHSSARTRATVTLPRQCRAVQPAAAPPELRENLLGDRRPGALGCSADTSGTFSPASPIHANVSPTLYSTST